MNKGWIPLALAMLSACASASPWVPAEAVATQAMTLVWVGHGECERLENGKWVRRPEFDYDFSVEQRRIGDHWESVKSMRRRHPDYDGSAGERLQTMFFHIDYRKAEGADRGVEVKLQSTLGNGTGTTDREFRHAVLEFAAAGVSRFAPFDRYRITQTYDYEAGTLSEMVELNDGDEAWVRNKESAVLFAATRFTDAPSKL